MKKKMLALVMMVGIITLSCQKEDPAELTVSTTELSFSKDGGSQNISFTTNKDWTATSSAAWVKVTSSGTSDSKSISISVEANPDYDDRSAIVTIKAAELTQTVSIKQSTNLGLLVTKNKYELTNDSQTIEIEVRANVEYDYSIDEACKSWIAASSTKALSSTKVKFDITKNESYDNREGKIVFKQKNGSLSETVTVKQGQTNGLFLTTSEYAVSNSEHNITVEVKANVEFQVTSEADWITYVETKGLKTSNIALKVAKNETYDKRVGTVKVKQTNGSLAEIITITQDENLGLFVSPEKTSITKDAQEVEVEVQANVDYDIIVPEEAKGMITTIKTEGGETKALVRKKVRFGISENPKYVGREASVTFKQNNGELCGTVKISQAQRDTLYVSPQKDSVSWEGATVKFDVVSNVDYNMIISEDVNWFTISEPVKGETKDGLTPYTYSLKTIPNEDREDRVEELVFENKETKTSTRYCLVQGGVPIISFADENVKTACVSHFDSNKDGEISLLEARSVSSLGDIFNSKKWVYKSFNELKEFTSITEITKGTFDGLENLQSISFPMSLVSIGQYAFLGCRSLANIEFSENITSIGNWAFEGCSSIQEITLHKGISNVGTFVFNGCTALRTVILNNEPSSLSTGLFNGCKSLKYINIPQSVHEISDWVFRDCGLVEVQIPSAVEYIGAQAFGMNSSLMKVVCDSQTAPILSSSSFHSFYSIPTSAKLFVPKGCVGAYSSWAPYFGSGIHERED